VGIAEQRKAIVDGLADSIKELKGANVELTEEQIMSILLTNQSPSTIAFRCSAIPTPWRRSFSASASAAVTILILSASANLSN